MAKDANELVIPAIDTTASNIVGSLKCFSFNFPPRCCRINVHL